VSLKKVLQEVKIINAGLVSKEKLLTTVRSKKVRLNVKELGAAELITALICKQGELEQNKRINNELGLRMDSLIEVEENQGDLDRQLIANADQLLLQQDKIKRMQLMQKGIIRQREIIAELEKVFE
jgi:hypothetical protein